MGNAPAVIAICQDMAVRAHKGGDLGRDYLSIADSSMAAQNIMLAAHALGLGTCAIASFHRRGMQQILGLPAEIVPMLLLSVGIPAQPARAPTREKDVMWFNEYPKSAD
jgi:nitroreductase